MSEQGERVRPLSRRDARSHSRGGAFRSLGGFRARSTRSLSVARNLCERAQTADHISQIEQGRSFLTEGGPAPPSVSSSAALEVAVAGVRLVDSLRCACRDDPGHDDDELLGALVARDVHAPARVDVGRPRRMPVRRAIWIVTAVEGGDAGLDDHEAGAGMAVPAEVTAWRDLVLADDDLGL